MLGELRFRTKIKAVEVLLVIQCLGQVDNETTQGQGMQPQEKQGDENPDFEVIVSEDMSWLGTWSNNSSSRSYKVFKVPVILLSAGL